MTSQKYEQTRSCAECGYEETRFLDELTAAFEQTRAWSEPCSQCGSTDFSSASNVFVLVFFEKNSVYVTLFVLCCLPSRVVHESNRIAIAIRFDI
jgi:predicted nucleic-acid-binding Zn-ribbon protein